MLHGIEQRNRFRVSTKFRRITCWLTISTLRTTDHCSLYFVWLCSIIIGRLCVLVCVRICLRLEIFLCTTKQIQWIDIHNESNHFKERIWCTLVPLLALQFVVVIFNGQIVMQSYLRTESYLRTLMAVCELRIQAACQLWAKRKTWSTHKCRRFEMNLLSNLLSHTIKPFAPFSHWLLFRFGSWRTWTEKNPYKHSFYFVIEKKKRAFEHCQAMRGNGNFTFENWIYL